VIQGYKTNDEAAVTCNAESRQVYDWQFHFYAAPISPHHRRLFHCPHHRANIHRIQTIALTTIRWWEHLLLSIHIMRLRLIGDK